MCEGQTHNDKNSLVPVIRPRPIAVTRFTSREVRTMQRIHAFNRLETAIETVGVRTTAKLVAQICVKKCGCLQRDVKIVSRGKAHCAALNIKLSLIALAKS